MGIRQSANMGVTIKINKTFVIEFPLIYWDGHQINNPESNIQQHMLTFLIVTNTFFFLYMNNRKKMY